MCFRKDKREYVYTLAQFEDAKTHDNLWNAAQRQMRIEGKMHGFLRMYWAKKILEWTKTPEDALRISMFLNDKYSMDGRDPSGYVGTYESLELFNLSTWRSTKTNLLLFTGCMWSVCGTHDQGWREREVFGKIRYMNYAGCKRKFDVDKFIMRYRKL